MNDSLENQLHAKSIKTFIITIFVLVLFTSCRPHSVKQTTDKIAPISQEPLSSKSGDTLLEPARNAFERQDYRDALTQIKKALSRGASKSEALDLRADIFKAAGYLDRCVETLIEWKTLAPTDPSPSNRLFFEYLQLGWRVEAERESKRLTELSPHDPRTLQTKALLGFRSQQPSTAIEPIAEARKLDPKNRTLFEVQVSILNRAGRGEEAERAMRAFLNFDSLSNSDQKLLLTSYMVSKKNKEALELATKLSVLIPSDPEIHFQRGILLEKQGDMKTAALSYDKTVSLSRGFGNSLWKLGHAYVSLGRVDEGKRLMREYESHDKYTSDFETTVKQLESHPDDPKLHLKLANFHSEADEAPEAIMELKKVLQLQPQNHEVRLKLKDALQRQGRKTEANQIR